MFYIFHLFLSSICQTLVSLWPHNGRGVWFQQRLSLPGGLGARITSTMTIRSIRGVERYYWRFLLSKSQEPFVPRITPTMNPLIKPYLGGEYPTEQGVPGGSTLLGREYPTKRFETLITSREFSSLIWVTGCKNSWVCRSCNCTACHPATRRSHSRFYFNTSDICNLFVNFVFTSTSSC